ncbi:hypothetical protein PoB_000644000 [Plakobranchus ocellatus]|uniref:Sushi domain-containing protein n=1 Tax=Plakobranchus ocellatus TaxID=259542 RepID=A0AAV3YB03_9GAST|nr:hypothetical protein PoB_000644000 [Plakobranchus ocellatus]
MILVFLCVAVFNKNSCCRGRSKSHNKDCNFHGKTHKHRTSFQHPPGSCRQYKCHNGAAQPYRFDCAFRGRCYELNLIARLWSGNYRCVPDGDRSKFVRIFKDCTFHGKTYKNGKTAFHPPDGCREYMCNDGKMEFIFHLRPSELLSLHADETFD